jgi:hypothetical protein
MIFSISVHRMIPWEHEGVDHATEKNDPSNHKQRSPAYDKKGVSSREGRSAASPLQAV